MKVSGTAPLCIAMPSRSYPPEPAVDLSVEGRFLAINRARLLRIRELLSPEQSRFVDTLPVLFHLNDPALPGFVSKQTPAGIREYIPTWIDLDIAEQITGADHIRPVFMGSLDIVGIYLLGSTGTIAHSTHSDFDIWICHASDLDEPRVEQLRRKAMSVSRWAKQLGLDAHFFVFSPERFRGGERPQLSTDSSGSTQRYLLLDEFYRSAVIAAGLPPVWWLTPLDEQGDYARCIERIYLQSPERRGQYVDFGSVAQIPAAEFSGATLWQLYKSLTSPYKSILKLLLLEAYVSSYPSYDLLSLRYKRAVCAGMVDLDTLDPYLFMYRRVEAYLMERQDWQRLEVARRCLCLKVGDAWSPRNGGGWRRRCLETLFSAWGWDGDHVSRVCDRNNVSLDTIYGERRELFKALATSFSVLAEFARPYAGGAGIARCDLAVLSKRFHGAYDRTANKLDIFNRATGADLRERHICLHARSDANTRAWALLRGAPAASGDATPIKTTSGLVEILAWSHVNGIIDAETEISVLAPDPQSALQRVDAIRQILGKYFSITDCHGDEESDARANPRVTRAVFFLEPGQALAHEIPEDLERLKIRGPESVDLVFATSWGELYCHHYVDEQRQGKALFDSLREYLRACSASGDASWPKIKVCLMSNPGENAAAGAMERFIEHVSLASDRGRLDVVSALRAVC
ncbi:MAG: class I adenylate cyclase [Gammaproteobacteria bacterium]